VFIRVFGLEISSPFLYDSSLKHKRIDMAKILVPLANGFEEIEAVTIIDVNVRAGNDVVTASLNECLEVVGANGITLKANTTLEEVKNDDFDMIVLPGGAQGTENLASNETLTALLQTYAKNNKPLAAICAAPYALHHAGVLSENFTCYPSFEQQIRTQGYNPHQAIVQDGLILTSRGPGTAIYFALEIVKMLNGEEVANALKEGMLVQDCK
jgi:4-methyl-5(b-hydroxyethyl)-thiazole monophosphate biosynthesis